MRDCRKCRDWGDCIGKDGYESGEIQFCRWQIMWLLYYRAILENGEYPSGKTFDWPPTLVKGARSGAYFETPAGLIGLVMDRLAKTEKDGKILVLIIDKMTDDTGDTIYSTYEDKVKEDRDARAALGYINGWKPKRMLYSKWRWQRDHRR